MASSQACRVPEAAERNARRNRERQHGQRGSEDDQAVAVGLAQRRVHCWRSDADQRNGNKPGEATPHRADWNWG